MARAFTLCPTAAARRISGPPRRRPAKPRQVTKFTAGRVLWPSIGYDGKSVVFERDFKIWQLDTKSGEAYNLPIKLVGSGRHARSQHLTLTQFNDLELSAGWPQIAVIGHGEIFAASARDGGTAFRVTHTPAAETQVAWAPDSMRVAYLSQRDAVNHIFLYDFAHHTETQLTNDPQPDQATKFSPDGKTWPSCAIARNCGPSISNRRRNGCWYPDTWAAVSAPAPSRGRPIILDRLHRRRAGGLRNVYVVAAAGGAGRRLLFWPTATSARSIGVPMGSF